MSITRHNFSTEKHTDFFLTLRSRVNNYFSDSKTSRYANTNMIIKTIFMFSLYFVPYFFIVSGILEYPLLIFVTWCIMGIGIAGIGLNIMHDANHGVYTKNKFWNSFLSYTMDLVGSNAAVWRIQHNVLHHVYTNIQNTDEDINGIPFLLRFSPHQKRYKIHRFQFLYAWFFYGLMTLMRVFYSDFVQLFKFKKESHFRSEKEFRKELFILIFSKSIYFIYVLVIPAFTCELFVMPNLMRVDKDFALRSL